ncbi:MAG: nucleotidyl transferase AbiEii/AbiGii toxin family protein [Chloroflexota bacterium]|nr:nucleotidyl transferase AbiEii/AbiGii toxin family protein [Chloroflexota bacterium]MDE2683344.1 nucleotidyl transferase AbiEii/AbiGii toxin family protein [Chloroflexota bacterium]
MTTNIAASIRARLLNRARTEGTEFQLFLDRYACERFLYRLGESEVRDRCILKGASLLALWMDEPYRSTRDIDLLTLGDNDEETVRYVMGTICNVSCPEDGMALDVSTLKISAIRDGQRYGGQRATIIAFLGNAKCNVQVDFGFGDVVIPGPEEAQLPVLIGGLPAPFLLTYPQASSIAEKFEAMVQLGTGNSRMKDFYDVWALSETFGFDGPELQEAVARCLDRRGTPWSAETPEALTAAFYSNPQRQDYWTTYGHQGGLLNVPPSAFEEIGSRIQSFLGPVRDSILAGEPFDLHWSAGGPWEARKPLREAGVD